MTAKARASQRGISLVLCPAFDTIEGCPLMLQEKFAIAAKLKGGRGCNRPERAGLPNEVEIAIGMEVMVTFNVLANGARGHLVDIVLDPRETVDINNRQAIELQYPPTYMLVQMCHMKPLSWKPCPRASCQ